MNSLAKVSHEKELAGPAKPSENEYITLSLTVAQAAVFLQWAQLHTPYIRQKHFIRNMPHPDAAQSVKELFHRTSGEDFHQCQFAGKNTNDKSVPATNCQASIALHFATGYQPSKTGLNIQEYGHLPVLVAWYFKHNHPSTTMKNLDDSALPEPVKKLILVALAKQTCESKTGETEFVNACWKDGMPAHFDNSRNIVLSQLQEGRVLHPTPKEACALKSLKSWSKQRKSQGMTRFKDDYEWLSSAGQGSPRPAKLWSFFCMSQWASESLKQSVKKIYVDCVKVENCSTGESGDVYLYSVWDYQSRAHPLAFMMANAQQRHVIAHFLYKVKTHADFTPEEVFYDCDAVLHCAAKDVWPGVETTPFYWPIFRAFDSLVLSVNNLLDVPETPVEISTQIDDDFRSVVHKSVSQDEAEQAMRAFLDKYMAYPLAIVSVKRRWDASVADEIAGDLQERFHGMATWHSAIQTGMSRMQERRPDGLLYLMVDVLEAKARASDIAREKGAAQKNTAGEKSISSATDRISDCEILKSVVVEKDGHFLVRSRQGEFYSSHVHILDSKPEQATCTCAAWIEDQGWCEHIFLALKWMEVSARVLAESEKPPTQADTGAPPQKLLTNGDVPAGEFQGNTAVPPMQQVQQTFPPAISAVGPAPTSGPVPTGPVYPGGPGFILPANFGAPQIYMPPNAAAQYPGMQPNYAAPPQFQQQQLPGNFHAAASLAHRQGLVPPFQGQGPLYQHNPYVVANVPANQNSAANGVPVQAFVGPNARIAPEYAAPPNMGPSSQGTNQTNGQIPPRVPMQPLHPTTPNTNAVNGACRSDSSVSKSSTFSESSPFLKSTVSSPPTVIDLDSPPRNVAKGAAATRKRANSNSVTAASVPPPAPPPHPAASASASKTFKDGEVMFIDDKGNPVYWTDDDTSNKMQPFLENISDRMAADKVKQFYEWKTRMRAHFEQADFKAQIVLMKKFQAAQERIKQYRLKRRTLTSGRFP